MVIICDIDGTISDPSHRKHFVECPREAQDWDRFYAPQQVMADPVIPKAAEFIDKMIRFTAPGRFHFVTGRPERLRDLTSIWLKRHLPSMLEQNTLMWMRPDRDLCKAVVHKERVIRKILGNLTAGLFIDDDARNEDMYRRYGIFLKAPECWLVMR